MNDSSPSDYRPGGSVSGGEWTLREDECVLGRDRVCKRTDAAHAYARLPDTKRFWRCPLHDDQSPIDGGVMPGRNWQKMRDLPPQERSQVEDTTIDQSEMVHHPAHYGGADDPYEVRKVIRAWGLGFDLGNAVKYIARAGRKDPAKHIEDLEKAVFYLQDEIEHLKEIL